MASRIPVTFSGAPQSDQKQSHYVHFCDAVVNATQRLSQMGSVNSVHVSVVRDTDVEIISQNKKIKPADDSEKSDLSNYESMIKAPRYTWSQLILPQSTQDSITTSIRLFEVREIVFNRYGLKAIEPFPRSCLNFFGPPGTGKTMAAHAIAEHLNRKIMEVSYADVASKFFGEGAKNIKGIFEFASSQDVILFIDEADSLLSRRITDTSQGSGQAINSMRSQVLTSIEQFGGIIIFATNLLQNYDPAFETRVRHIEFTIPDETCAKRIWEVHLPASLPLEEDVSAARLALSFRDICGRDIKSIVIEAAVRSVLDSRQTVSWLDFEIAYSKVRVAGRNRAQPKRLTNDDVKEIVSQISVEGS